MILKKKVAVLVVAFLGTPKTLESKLKDSEIRFLHTKEAFLKIKKHLISNNLYLGLVGDRHECNRLIHECGLGVENARWFDQDERLINKGVGALENQLILKCIKYWSLQKEYDYIIKVTGKYQVLNIDDIILLANKIKQPIYAWKILFQNMVDTRVFIFNGNFYLKSQEFMLKIDSHPGFWVENIIYELIKNNKLKFGSVICRPILKGLAGTTNKFSYTSIHKRILIKVATKLFFFR